MIVEVLTRRHELGASLHDHLVDVDHGDELGAVVAEFEELLDEAAVAATENENPLVLEILQNKKSDLKTTKK